MSEMSELGMEAALVQINESLRREDSDEGQAVCCKGAANLAQHYNDYKSCKTLEELTDVINIPEAEASSGNACTRVR